MMYRRMGPKELEGVIFLNKVDKLTKLCGENGYSWEIQYSEAENTYYGMILDYLQQPSIIHEIKRISSFENLIDYMVARLTVDRP